MVRERRWMSVCHLFECPVEWGAWPLTRATGLKSPRVPCFLYPTPPSQSKARARSEATSYSPSLSQTPSSSVHLMRLCSSVRAVAIVLAGRAPQVVSTLSRRAGFWLRTKIIYNRSMRRGEFRRILGRSGGIRCGEVLDDV